jgi:hypothetical protein
MTPDLLENFAVTTAAFIPVHQGAVEAIKSLTRIKLRRYFEAIAGVVYGRDFERVPGADRATRLGRLEWLVDDARIVPAKLGAERRRAWVRGAERQLVEAFMIRGVGDSPNPEISDADVENVARIIREEAAPALREAARRLRLLVAQGVADGRDAAAIAREIPAEGELRAELDAFAARVGGLATPTAVNVEVNAFAQAFVERFMQREYVARIELPNALKSAELRYHMDLLRISTLVALLEAIAIVQLIPGTTAERLFGGIAAAALLFVGSQGSKGLLDALIGLGGRLRG